MARLRATILGCGSSPGVPRIGNDWGACDPAEPKNRRLRCSMLIEREGPDGKTVVLVDTGPDLRTQLLAADVKRLDAVVYTHPHADHIHGIDDLRAFWLNTKRRVDIYADVPTHARLTEAFGYCFSTPAGSLYPPILVYHPMSVGTAINVQGPGGPIRFLPFRQQHGDIDSLGLKVGTLAYSCDINELPDDSATLLRNIGVWIVDALRYKPHPSHFSVAESLAAIEKIGAKRGVLTHMHTDLDYQRLRAELPAHVEPAFDGMKIAFEAAD
jgi:phosphoribosyl 1,2-cyclic phosphate phosphodiesterase